MNRRTAGIASVVVVAAIAIVAALVYHFGPARSSIVAASQSPTIGKAQLGQRAPQFVVATNAGLFDLNAATKPVFLEVFATWCPHCQRETKVIDRLYDQYKTRVAFVAVSGSNAAMDESSSSSELDVLDWIRKFNVKYPVAYDPLLSVSNLYLQGGFPTLAIIGTNKSIDYLDSGEIGYPDLDSAIRKVLK
jgi:thiol-disulfide isomerase/thioredoxin